jgi:type I restriction enzyme S subunit
METLQPKLRFPEFEGNWKTQQLGDVGDIKMCRRIFNEETTTTGDIPFFKIGSFGKVADAFISKELYLNYRSRFSFPKKGDILISAAGTIGRTVVYNGEDAYFQDSNIVWINNDNTITSNEFLFYVYQIVSFNTEGGTIQRLYNNILKSTKFFNPSLEEQTKIANFLSAVDEKLNLLKEKKSLLENYKKGIMQKIFNQEIRFKDDNGNDFEDWKEAILSEVVNLFHGYQFRTSDFTTKGIAVIKISNVIGNNLDLNNLTFIKKERFEDFKNFEINNDDILMSLTGNIGRIIEVKDKPFSLLQNYRVGKFIPLNENIINKPFLKYLLASDLVFGRFSQLANQSAQANFGKQDMDKINISYPTIDEQTKIANFLSAIDEKIDLVSTQIEDTQEYKKGLLQQMFV